MKRRTFLWTLTLAGSAMAIPIIYRRYQNSKWDQPLIHPFVLSHFCDEETIRQIGMEYRSQFPSENSVEKITALLIKENTFLLSDNASTARKLEKNIQAEFKSNKIITIDGWVLSTTEARQCALFSFTQTSAP
jgi:hypothetical protein